MPNWWAVVKQSAFSHRFFQKETRCSCLLWSYTFTWWMENRKLVQRRRMTPLPEWDRRIGKLWTLTTFTMNFMKVLINQPITWIIKPVTVRGHVQNRKTSQNSWSDRINTSILVEVELLPALETRAPLSSVESIAGCTLILVRSMNSLYFKCFKGGDQALMEKIQLLSLENEETFHFDRRWPLYASLVST